MPSQYKITDAATGKELSMINTGIYKPGTVALPTIRITNVGDLTDTALELGVLLSNRQTSGTNAQGLEAVTEGWVEAKESGQPDGWEDEFEIIDENRWDNSGWSLDNEGLSCLHGDSANIITQQSDTVVDYWSGKTITAKFRSDTAPSVYDDLFIGFISDKSRINYYPMLLGLDMLPNNNEIWVRTGSVNTFNISAALPKLEWIYCKFEIHKNNPDSIMINLYYSLDNDNWIFIGSYVTEIAQSFIVYASSHDWTINYVKCVNRRLKNVLSGDTLSLTTPTPGSTIDIELNLVVPGKASTVGDYNISLELFAR